MDLYRRWTFTVDGTCVEVDYPTLQRDHERSHLGDACTEAAKGVDTGTHVDAATLVTNGRRDITCATLEWQMSVTLPDQSHQYQ